MKKTLGTNKFIINTKLQTQQSYLVLVDSISGQFIKENLIILSGSE